MTTWVVISQFMIACGGRWLQVQRHMFAMPYVAKTCMPPQWLHMQFHVAAKLQRQSYLKCHVAKNV